jgi:predicted dinucleotide-utilizing enzyme
MAKFKVVMREILSKPDNPFKIGWINECARRREAVIEAESEQAVREYFEDAKRRDFETVRGFELVKVELSE